jgi:two-component system, NtrC family, nitrogen regulation sensor histidine kinase NtrY
VRRRFFNWARQVNFWSKAEAALIGVLLVVAVTSYIVLAGSGAPTRDGSGPRLTLLLILNTSLLLLLALLVGRRLAVLIANRRRGQAGARLHLRMMQWFAIMAIVPSLLVAVFASLLFERSVAFGFSDQVRTIVEKADDVARAYVFENRERIRGDMLAMATDMRGFGLALRTPDQLQSELERQASYRNLDEAVLFKRAPDGAYLDWLARVNFRFGMSQYRLRQSDVEAAARGELVILSGEGNESTSIVQALMLLEPISGTFLYVNREVSSAVVGQVVSTRNAIAEYEELDAQRATLQTRFLIVLIATALLILFAAVLVALYSADRLVAPIGRLVRAAERVGRGDLGARVPVRRETDELALLGRAFNRMTSQLQTQTGALLDANSQLDERRRFTQAVLEGVSAGVLAITPGGRISLANRSALQLLDTDASALIARPLIDVMPELAELLDDPKLRSDAQVTGQIGLARPSGPRSFAVHIIAEQPHAGGEGDLVVTFDDITDALANQRRAAWSDVARRIAHEIKNPLTPIQLSAERLQRKYGKEIVTDPEVFEACTQTIVRQVGDLRRMVDEFSSFARMPKPVFRPESLSEIVRQTLFLQELAFPDIRFSVALPTTSLDLVCDRPQLTQALTNIIKNAAESVQARSEAQEPGLIAVRLWREGAWTGVSITDNGIGLPPDLRERLTEPYVTTRAKGTGLGLAIVKKIVEDHAGVLLLEDAPGSGAHISLKFQHELLAEQRAQKDPASAGQTSRQRVTHGL